MLVAVGAGKAAPGATCAATALALSWPRPVLLVDADPAGGDIAPGLLPGRVRADLGLLTWATSTRRLSVMEAIDTIPSHVVALPEAPDLWLMPGLHKAAQAPGVATAYGRLAQALERVSSVQGPVQGRDVIVDLGRLSDASFWPVAEACDVFLLAARPTARSITASLPALELVARRVGDTDRVRLLPVGTGPYTAGQMSAVLGGAAPGSRGDLDVVPHLAHDPAGAAVLTDGAPTGIGGLRRSKLMRSASVLADHLLSTLNTPTPPTPPTPGPGNSPAVAGSTPATGTTTRTTTTYRSGQETL